MKVASAACALAGVLVLAAPADVRATQSNAANNSQQDRTAREKSTLSGSYLASLIAVADHDTAAAAY
jgi:hypothetical protein